VEWNDFGSEQALVLATNRTRMEGVDEESRQKCAFWESIADEVGH
jgi:hypothetical protein